MSSVSRDKEEFSMVIELATPAADAACTLAELLERESNVEPVASDASPLCPHCGKAPENSRSLHLVDAHDLLLISLNRCSVVQQQRRDDEPVFVAAKRRSYVQPDSHLDLGGRRYLLKSVVVHRGKRPSSGHYVC